MDRMRTSLLGLPLICLACGAGEDDTALSEATLAVEAPGFGATFDDCTEFAGIGLVPAANARALVPMSYTLAGDAGNAVVVVRVANCQAVSVSGQPSLPGTVAQVGVMLTPVDPSADINNYTLWFATNSGPLEGALHGLGVNSANDQLLSYVFSPDGLGAGDLAISVTPPQGPDYSAAGTATIPTSEATSFVATWWSDGTRGTVQMRTEFPEIKFSNASITVSTDPTSKLGQLIGGGSLSFAILNSYNSFSGAELQASRVD